MFHEGDIIIYGYPIGHAAIINSINKSDITIYDLTGNKHFSEHTILIDELNHIINCNKCKSNFKVIRWKGDKRVYKQILHYMKIIDKHRDKIKYNKLKAISSAFNFCFKKISDSTLHELYNDDLFIELLTKDGSFCSHFIFFIMKFAIGSVASKNNGMIKDCNGIEQNYTKALNITPSKCFPTNAIQFPKKYPDFWELVQF